MEQVLEQLLGEQRPVKAPLGATSALAREDGLSAQPCSLRILAPDHRVEGDCSQSAQVVRVEEEGAGVTARGRLVEEAQVVRFGGRVDERAAMVERYTGQQAGGLALANPGEHRHR